MLANIMIFLLLFLLGQARTYAASESRNGGYGVITSTGIVSYDLHLRDVYNSPYLSANSGYRVSKEERELLEARLSRLNISSAVLDEVEAKLSELNVKATSIGLEYTSTALVANMARFVWLKVNLPCLDVRDEDDPVQGKVQVAYREGTYIRLCRDFYRMDTNNQAALILHEIVYANAINLNAVLRLVGLAFDPDFSTFESDIQLELRGTIEALNTLEPSMEPRFEPSIEDRYGRYYLRVLDGQPMAGTLITVRNPALILDQGFYRRRGPDPMYMAQTICSQLSLLGYSNWRLPTDFELLELIRNGIGLVNGFNTYVWFSQTAREGNEAMSLDSGNRMKVRKNESENTICIR